MSKNGPDPASVPAVIAELEEQAAEMEQHEQRIQSSGFMDPLTSKSMRYQSRGRQRKRNPNPPER
jgi:hypothetical protein